MNKSFGLIILSLAISACTPSATEYKPEAVLPDGVKDCSFYIVSGGNGYSQRIVRCPLSDTSTTYKDETTSVVNTVVAKPDPREEALKKLSSSEKKVLGLE